MQACRNVSTPPSVRTEASSKVRTETDREFYAGHTFNVKEIGGGSDFICFKCSLSIRNMYGSV